MGQPPVADWESSARVSDLRRKGLVALSVRIGLEHWGRRRGQKLKNRTPVVGLGFSVFAHVTLELHDSSFSMV